MNSVNLIGRLTADPEIRYLESGKSVAKFSIAVSRSKEEADFFDVEAWEKTAEVISQFCKKGSQVGVSGSIHQERWRDKATETNRSRVIVRCARIELLGSKQDGESQNQPQPERQSTPVPAQVASPQPQPVTNYAAKAPAIAAAEPDYDDIPF